MSEAPQAAQSNTRRPETVEGYVTGVLGGDPAMMGRAITLVESRKPAHRQLASEVLQRLLPHAGKARRIGITGVPGVGKSTFIETFGRKLTADGHKVAVLAVDPTSSRTGGSILGDKTRMLELGRDPHAFIRPSPSAGTLGGVARATREAMVVCEAAGFDVIIVETVGVGQSEIVVAEMVDFFLVLMLPGAGDELQGIKKGVLEIADMLAVNKADGGNAAAARLAAAEYRRALQIMTPHEAIWQPPVVTCSALQGDGLDEIWKQIGQHKETLDAAGAFDEKRRRQQVDWMRAMVRDSLAAALEADEQVRAILPDIEKQVAEGMLAPSLGADRMLAAFMPHSKGETE